MNCMQMFCFYGLLILTGKFETILVTQVAHTSAINFKNHPRYCLLQLHLCVRYRIVIVMASEDCNIDNFVGENAFNNYFLMKNNFFHT